MSRVSIDEEYRHPDYATCQSLIRRCIDERRAGRLEQSIRTGERAFERARRAGLLRTAWQARSFIALAHVDGGRPELARSVHAQNLALAERLDNACRSATIAALGDLDVEAGDLDAALTRFAADPSLDDDGPGTGRANARQRLGVVQYLAGDLPAAEHALRGALSDYDRFIRDGTQHGLLDACEVAVEVVRWLLQVLVARGATDEALALSETGRARALALLMRGRHGLDGRELDARRWDRDAIQRLARAHRATLVVYSVGYRYRPNHQLMFGFGELLTTSVLIWVATGRGPIGCRRVEVEPATSLGRLVSDVRAALGVETGAGEAQPGAAVLRRAHGLLVEPVEALLPRDARARVVLVPQDELMLVPFAALRDARGHELVDLHTLSVAPSLSVLADTRARRANQTVRAGAVVVGDPAMPRGLPQIPGARREADVVARLCHARALTGAAATRTAVIRRLCGARVAHLATHGLLDEDAAFHALALAPDDGGDGLLTTREIRELDIGLDLVVLSACNTGTGRVTGDGVLGLSRAFLAAGANSLVVSLWDVDDASTAMLMTRLFAALARGADKDAALRAAMLAVRERYGGGHHWAAFALVGQAGPLDDVGRFTGDAQPRPWAECFARPVLPLPDDASDYRQVGAGTGRAIETVQTARPPRALLAGYDRWLGPLGYTADGPIVEHDAGCTRVWRRANGQSEITMHCTVLSPGARWQLVIQSG